MTMCSGFFPLNMVICHSYVSLPEGNVILRYFPLRTIIYDGHGRVIVIHPNGSVWHFLERSKSHGWKLHVTQ